MSSLLNELKPNIGSKSSKKELEGVVLLGQVKHVGVVIKVKSLEQAELFKLVLKADKCHSKEDYQKLVLAQE